MLESLLDKFKEKRREGLNSLRKSELRNILILSLSMLRVQTVCLNKLKGAVGQITGKENTQPASHYQRLVRIFRQHAFSRLWLDLLRFVFSLLRLKSEYLVLDGTSWKRGDQWHHYLTLSIVYQKVSIPIYWINLQKHGISNIAERIDLMRRVLRTFDLSGKTLLADREYIGIEWFKFLIDNGLAFIIRLKKNTYCQYIDAATGKSVQQMIDKVKRSKVANKSMRKAFQMQGMDLYFVVCKNPDPNAKEELIFLITNKDQCAAQIAAKYGIRWSIEHCFKQLKSNGFDLEAINVKGKFKQQLLIAIVVFTYVLSILEGLKTYKKVPTKINGEGKQYKAVSLFRHGCDYLVSRTASFERFIQYIIQQFELLQAKYLSPHAILYSS
ncbi:MAG: transposase [Bacteroidota bacterium]